MKKEKQSESTSYTLTTKDLQLIRGKYGMRTGLVLPGLPIEGTGPQTIKFTNSVIGEFCQKDFEEMVCEAGVETET